MLGAVCGHHLRDLQQGRLCSARHHPDQPLTRVDAFVHVSAHLAHAQPTRARHRRSHGRVAHLQSRYARQCGHAVTWYGTWWATPETSST